MAMLLLDLVEGSSSSEQQRRVADFEVYAGSLRLLVSLYEACESILVCLHATAKEWYWPRRS